MVLFLKKKSIPLQISKDIILKMKYNSIVNKTNNKNMLVDIKISVTGTLFSNMAPFPYS